MPSVKKRVAEDLQASLRKTKHKKRSIRQVFFTLLIAFAVIAFWRGMWMLMDLIIFPSNFLYSAITSAIIGVLILYFTKHLVKELV